MPHFKPGSHLLSMALVRSDRSRIAVSVAPNMLGVIERAKSLAAFRCNVLISGETGTGKELIARAVHGGKGPFVVIDCTHLSEQLAERELFGNTRGAYTGADADRIGLVEIANGGTAFLDEVGELPWTVQAKFLRLLQEKTYRPVGSVQERHSDFRVIAATNRNLKQETNAGRFRQDLYFRLKGAGLRIPPLRERKEDIPILAEYFLRGTGLEMSAEFIQKLCEYPWPGNVRELENCMSSLVATATGSLLSGSDLPGTIHEPNTCEPFLIPTKVADVGILTEGVSSRERIRTSGAYGSSAPSLPPERHNGSNTEAISDRKGWDWSELPSGPIRQMEEQAILNTLRRTGGDRTQACSLLKMSRSTLYRKITAMTKRQNSTGTTERDGLLQPAKGVR